MNFLFLNNFHYLRGGSERVLFDEMDLIRKHGHKATVFARKCTQHVKSEHDDCLPKDIKTDSIQISSQSASTLMEIFYSRETKKCLRKLLAKFRPDLAHAHNIYGRLTSSVLDLLAQRDIPVVMTLHDYKLICPSYKMLNGGKVCEACKGKNFYLSARNRCHKRSLLASAVVALESYFCSWSEKYTKNVKLFIAPSRFLRNKFVEFGWAGDRIIYLPNFISLSGFEPDVSPGKYFLYIGRLSAEKGLLTLIEAFHKLGHPKAELLIVGEGPERKLLEKRASIDERIRFTGYLSGDRLKDTTRNALAVVVPSEWYENAPISLLESLAYGKPVVASRIGGIPEMVDDGFNGYLFNPGCTDDLRQKLELFMDMSKRQIREMGNAARQKAEKQFAAELHFERLMEVYRRAARMR